MEATGFGVQGVQVQKSPEQKQRERVCRSYGSEANGEDADHLLRGRARTLHSQIPKAPNKAKASKALDPSALNPETKDLN